MKIDGNNLSGITPEAPAPKPGAGTAAAGSSAAGSAEAARRAARLGYGPGTGEGAAPPDSSTPPDQVELSDLGRELIRLAQSDPEREARIERLAQEYAAGRLQTDASAVAGKMVDDALEGSGEIG